MPILEPLTTNRYAVKDSFNFATEIVGQDSSNCMDSLEICTNEFFKKIGMVHSLKKVNLKVFYL